jgi:tetratricopeptide (TPR) repeat protein
MGVVYLAEQEQPVRRKVALKIIKPGMDNLAEIYIYQRKYDQAEPLTKFAYEQRRETLGNTDPDVLVWLNNLAGLYVAQGKPDKSETLLAEALEHLRPKLPKEHPQIGATLAMLTLARLQLKNYAEAEEVGRECLAIREKQAPNAWQTFNAKSVLGGELRAALHQRAFGDVRRKDERRIDGVKAVFSGGQPGDDAAGPRDENGTAFEIDGDERQTCKIAVVAEVFFERPRGETCDSGGFGGAERHDGLAMAETGQRRG